MTIEQAKKHPFYNTACTFARRMGLSGGMDNMEYGLIVMAYLSGYNKGYRDQYKNLSNDFYFIMK